MTQARVGIDGTIWGNARGYGRFARNAVRRLVELDESTAYVLYMAPTDDADSLPDGLETRAISVANRPADSSRGVGELVRAGWRVSRDRLDAFLFPSVYSYFPVVGVPTIVGVHDVIADQLPHLLFPHRRNRVLWRLKESIAVRQASRVFTVSATSRAAVASRFRMPESRLAVVPEAPDPVFRPSDEGARREVLAPLGLSSAGYLLYAGGINPHKNVETLIEAIAQVPSRPKLVLVGDLDDDSYLSSASEVKARIARLGLEQQVVLPGFVTDEALASLYSDAAAVVIPSLAEGFGLPAIEAASCGAAVLLSDIPAHRETMDGAALYFAPTDVRGLAGALEHVLGDERARRELQEKAAAKAARLSWDETARCLRSLVGEVVEG